MFVNQYHSNGKLLITGEYLVLDGALSLALPTKLGQELTVKHTKDKGLCWNSLDHQGNTWFKTVFELTAQKILQKYPEQQSIDIELTLLNILNQAKTINSKFLDGSTGVDVSIKLGFPKNWGLGSSSTLINNIAKWAKVDPYILLEKSFGGSGYDIACAQHDTPIFYQLVDRKPKVVPIDFYPKFHEQLYFVFLNKKQNSREGIKNYRSKKDQFQFETEEVSQITQAIIHSENLGQFERLIQEHERIISSIMNMRPIQEYLFKDYFGQIKSLGAWGGDFILVTGNEDSVDYFKNKGYATVISYDDMIKRIL